jgi:hypothetical protein
VPLEHVVHLVEIRLMLGGEALCAQQVAERLVPVQKLRVVLSIEQELVLERDVRLPAILVGHGLVRGQLEVHLFAHDAEPTVKVDLGDDVREKDGLTRLAQSLPHHGLLELLLHVAKKPSSLSSLVSLSSFRSSTSRPNTSSNLAPPTSLASRPTRTSSTLLRRSQLAPMVPRESNHLCRKYHSSAMAATGSAAEASRATRGGAKEKPNKK